VLSMTLHEVAERMDGNESEAAELKQLAEFAGTVLRLPMRRAILSVVSRSRP